MTTKQPERTAPATPEDPRERIRGGDRCGLRKSEWVENYFVAWVPSDNSDRIGGKWRDWVRLAKNIIAADEALMKLPADTRDELYAETGRGVAK